MRANKWYTKSVAKRLHPSTRLTSLHNVVYIILCIIPKFIFPLDLVNKRRYHSKYSRVIYSIEVMDMARRRRMRDEHRNKLLPLICILTVAFLCGAVLGSIVTSRLPSRGTLAELLLSAKGYTARQAFASYFWPLFVAVLFLFFASFVKTGLFVAPLVLFFHGMRASSGITTFIVGYGPKGYYAALIAELAPGFLSLAGLFLLSVQTMVHSSTHRPTMPRRIAADRAFLFSFLAGCVVILLASLLYAALLPTLTQSVLSAIG